jgi:esterase/lipase
LRFLTESLGERFAKDNVHILVPKSNAGNFTYDGIELGGERVTREVEEKLEELAKSGHEIKRMSVIGYSLGGLIARYAVGLLYHKGVFERIQPIVRP